MMYACQEDEIGQTPQDSAAPAPITNVVVENLPGGAKITYDIPADEDFLYVKATYNVNSQITRETRASYTRNEIILDGFGEAKTYPVTLVAADNSKNESKPVEIEVNPTTPPVQLLFESMKIYPDWGGVAFLWENNYEKEMNIILMAEDTVNSGEFTIEKEVYSKIKKGAYSLRGYPAEPTMFAFYVEDRWGNRSETKIDTLTPIFERELDTDLFKYVWDLTPNNVGNLGGFPPQNMWNDVIGNEGFISGWPNQRPIQDTLFFTMDLGKKSKLSRVKMWPRIIGSDITFGHMNMKRFRLWGSNDPDPDPESFTSWTDMGTYDIVKPSGLPVGQNTAEDIAAEIEGFEFLIPIEFDAVRYIRVQQLATWSGGSLLQISELKFFGKYDE